MAQITATEFWATFGRFTLWTMEVLGNRRILAILLICGASLALAFARRWPFKPREWRPYYWLAFTQVLFFPAMILVAVLFPAASPWPHPKANLVGTIWLGALFDLSLVTAGFWVYRMKGLRWFATSLMAVQQLLIFCASFVAGTRGI
jgi:hypothetical protein